MTPKGRVAGMTARLESRRRGPRQPLRRHPAMRWLRRPLLGGPKPRTGAPSPFTQGLEDGRREGLSEGLAEGYAMGYGDGLQAGAASAAGEG